MRGFYLYCKKLVPEAKIFRKGKEGDAGFDIWSLENAILLPFTTAEIHTGIATEFPPGWTGLIMDRGSTGSKGVMRKCGVVDANFRDEWVLWLYFTGPGRLDIEGVRRNPKAKAVAQVVFVPCGEGEVKEVDALTESDRKPGQWKGSSDAIH